MRTKCTSHTISFFKPGDKVKLVWLSNDMLHKANEQLLDVIGVVDKIEYECVYVRYTNNDYTSVIYWYPQRLEKVCE